MKFMKQSVSKHGTAYYTREGQKKGAIAVPGSQFKDGVAPESIEVGGSDEVPVEFAEKQARKTNGIAAEVRKSLTPEQKKTAREAARAAERQALVDMGALSL